MASLKTESDVLNLARDTPAVTVYFERESGGPEWSTTQHALAKRHTVKVDVRVGLHAPVVTAYNVGGQRQPIRRMAWAQDASYSGPPYEVRVSRDGKTAPTGASDVWTLQAGLDRTMMDNDGETAGPDDGWTPLYMTPEEVVATVFPYGDTGVIDWGPSRPVPAIVHRATRAYNRRKVEVLEYPGMDSSDFTGVAFLVTSVDRPHDAQKMRWFLEKSRLVVVELVVALPQHMREAERSRRASRRGSRRASGRKGHGRRQSSPAKKQHGGADSSGSDHYEDDWSGTDLETSMGSTKLGTSPPRSKEKAVVPPLKTVPSMMKKTTPKPSTPSTDKEDKDDKGDKGDKGDTVVESSAKVEETKGGNQLEEAEPVAKTESKLPAIDANVRKWRQEMEAKGLFNPVGTKHANFVVEKLPPPEPGIGVPDAEPPKPTVFGGAHFFDKYGSLPADIKLHGETGKWLPSSRYHSDRSHITTPFRRPGTRADPTRCFRKWKPAVMEVVRLLEACARTGSLHSFMFMYCGYGSESLSPSGCGRLYVQDKGIEIEHIMTYFSDAIANVAVERRKCVPRIYIIDARLPPPMCEPHKYVRTQTIEPSSLNPSVFRLPSHGMPNDTMLAFGNLAGREPWARSGLEARSDFIEILCAPKPRKLRGLHLPRRMLDASNPVRESLEVYAAIEKEEVCEVARKPWHMSSLRWPMFLFPDPPSPPPTPPSPPTPPKMDLDWELKSTTRGSSRFVSRPASSKSSSILPSRSASRMHTTRTARTANQAFAKLSVSASDPSFPPTGPTRASRRTSHRSFASGKPTPHALASRSGTASASATPGPTARTITSAAGTSVSLDDTPQWLPDWSYNKTSAERRQDERDYKRRERLESGLSTSRSRSGKLTSRSRPRSGHYTNRSRPGSGMYKRSGSGSYSRPGSGSYKRPGSGSYKRPGSGSYSRPHSGSYSRPGSGSYKRPGSGSYKGSAAVPKERGEIGGTKPPLAVPAP